MRMRTVRGGRKMARMARMKPPWEGLEAFDMRERRGWTLARAIVMLMRMQ